MHKTVIHILTDHKLKARENHLDKLECCHDDTLKTTEYMYRLHIETCHRSTWSLQIEHTAMKWLPSFISNLV